jgi:chromate transporter
MLSSITAAVVSVVLNLAVYLGRAGLFPSGEVQLGHLRWPSLLWALVSVVALYGFKLNLILWTAVSAVAGLLYCLGVVLGR